MQTHSLILRKLSGWKNDLLHLVYPEACLVCNQELSSGIVNVCPFCEADLRFTYFESFSEPTPMDKLFWGRADLDSTCAMLHFEQDSGTQHILHAIKYQGKRELATLMGSRFGERLLYNREKYERIGALVPVPLHPKKRFIRGYNQSELIAEGIGQAMNIPVIADFLTKGTHTASQTTKSRFMRWDNVSDVFAIRPDKCASIPHIALVDDVVTTGSTLEACVRQIRETLPEVRISVLSLAIAR